MKRIFKFRAWDPRWERMTYFNEGDDWNDSALASSPTLLSGFVLAHNTGGDEVLMQWTGFVDSEGKDIYEGDVIFQHGEEGLLEVYWKETYGCWYAYEDGQYGGGFEEGLADLLPVEVIGNIYENPELIKGGNEDG